MKVSEEHLWKPLAITVFLTEQQIILLYMCFYFRTPYLKHIVDSLVLNSWKTTWYLMNEWNLTNTHISHKTYCSLLAARNTGQNFSTGLWGHFKWKNCQEKEKKKKCGKCGTKYSLQRTHFTVWKMKQDVREKPYLTSAENMFMGQINHFFLLRWAWTCPWMEWLWKPCCCC